MSDRSPPDFAVVIPHYNDVARLRKCLDGLTRNDAALLARGEVVVADNNSSDDLSEVKAAFPGVRFVTQPERGAGAARNMGVAETTATRIFFTDADCVPSDNWLQVALDVIEGQDLVGGEVETFDETDPPRSGAEALETVFAFNQKRYVEQEKFSVTANLLTWRHIFEDVGDFDGVMSEDMDWCFRAHAKGYRIVFEPRLLASHPTRRDWAALVKKWRRVTDELFHLRGTDAVARMKWFIRAFAILVAAVPYSLKILKSPRLADTTERLRGIATVWRLHALRAAWMIRQVFGGRL